jgi:hypothetical protein
MAVRKFAGEDELGPFREWVSEKPKGYVLNTDSGLSDRGSTRLHRASCFTLEPGFGRRRAPDGRLHQGLLARPEGAHRMGGRQPRLRAEEPPLPSLPAELARAD